MLAAERQSKILDYLNIHRIASVGQLEELTGASPATLRRDLNLLESRGLLQKTRGGAQALPSGLSKSGPLAEIPERFPSLAWEPDPHLPGKDVIARKASAFVSTGDIIFVGAGMTCNLLCRYLSKRVRDEQMESLHVITTNITAVMELASNPRIHVLVLGGSVRLGCNHVETLDQYTLQALKSLYFDKVFFTVDGIDLDDGYSIINREQIPLYRYLLENTRESYLLASEEKYNRRAFTRLCNLEKIPNVITGPGIGRDYLARYRELGVQVILAEGVSSSAFPNDPDN